MDFQSPFLRPFVHIGEGHHAALRNAGEELLQVFSFVFGPSAEARADLIAVDSDGIHKLDLSAEQLKFLG